MSEQDDLLAEAEAEADELIDLTETEDISFAALPEGWYVCECVQAKPDTVKSGDSKGSPKLVLRFKPVDPESNKAIFKHAMLKGKGAPYTKLLLRNMGLDVDSGKVSADDCLGTLVRLYLIEGNIEGNNDIKKSEPYDGPDLGDVR